jgi:hypothetical protein
MYDLGLKNEKAKDEFFQNARQLDEAVASSDYEATLNSLDAPGFLEYYRYIGQFAGCYKIANWKDYREYEPIQIEQLNQELVKHEKTEEKLELVDSFHEEELQSEKFLFSSKVRLLYDILDDNFVGDDKEEGINKVLESFNTSDKASFIAKIQSDRNLLESLIDKVNGTEKDEMFGIIGELFITSGFISRKKITSLNNSKNDSINAEFEKGRVNIEIESPQKGGMRDYRTTITKRISADPFDIIGMTYDGRQIQLPALLLLKSWTNTFGTPEGIFYNYYKEDLDWNKLSADEKDEYFTDFVTHYLPSGFIKAFGNPLQIIILSCITVITAGLFAELEGALLAIGLTMTAIDAKNSIEGIVQANRLKETSQTTHEAKKAAKYMADNIAKLSIDALNVICAVAGYLKGKKTIKNKQTTQNLINKSTVSKENLIKYLEGIDKSNASKGNPTNYAATYKKKGKWPDDVQIPRSNDFIDSEGKIKFLELAPNDGYVKGTKQTIKDGIDFPKKGTKVDRYGSPDGRYVSPIIDGKPYSYEQRSLPFIEDSRQYHVYEIQYDSIIEAINNIKNQTKRQAFLDDYYEFLSSDESCIFRKGQIAPAFGQKGGGVQFEFGFSIEQLKKMGYIVEK